MRQQDPFEALLHRYRGLLYTLARHFARRGMEVDDLLQEASIALWRSGERLLALGTGPSQAALAWKIAKNTMIDTLRRLKPTEELPEGYDEADEDRTLLNELHERIAQLEEPDRTMVQMQLEGYSYKEIGDSLGMTEKNVSVRLVRVKERLKETMNR